MSRVTSRLLAIFVCSLLLVWPTYESDARGAKGGGFGRSSSSSSSMRSSRPMFSPNRSSSSSSSSSRSTWGSSSSSSWGSSTSRRSAPSSDADSALSTRVNRGGTMQSRGEAMDARESTSPSSTGGFSEGQSSPGTFGRSTQRSPSSSAPQTVRLPDGRHAPVYIDNSRGGAGFWDSVGNWVLLSTLMNSQNRGGYYPSPGVSYGDTSGGYRTGQAGSYSSGGGGGGGAVLAVIGLVILIFLVFVGMYMFRSGRRNTRSALGLDANGTPPPFPGGAAGDDRPRTRLEEWANLPPGSFVTLTDAQAIADSQARGRGVAGIDYKVEQVGVAKDIEGFATWVLVHLNDGHQKLMLMVKGDEAHTEQRVYYASEDFRPAKREMVLKRGDLWLFEEPADQEHVKPSHLLYAAEIPYSIGGSETVYVRKDQGERHADYTEKPDVGGLGAQVATIVEYSTSDSTENPELLVLEIATTNSKTGEVSLYLGTPVRASEVSIVKAA